MPTQPLSASLAYGALPFSMSENGSFTYLSLSLYTAVPVYVFSMNESPGGDLLSRVSWKYACAAIGAPVALATDCVTSMRYDPRLNVSVLVVLTPSGPAAVSVMLTVSWPSASFTSFGPS